MHVSGNQLVPLKNDLLSIHNTLSAAQIKQNSLKQWHEDNISKMSTVLIQNDLENGPERGI